MANTLITPDVLAPEATKILKNENVGYELMRNPLDQARFTGAEKVGSTIKVVTPGTADVNDFTGTLTPRDITETEIDLTIERHFVDSIVLTSVQKTLELQSFLDQVVAPIMAGFMDALGEYVLSKARQVPFHSGTAGAPPSTIADIANVGQVLSTNRAAKRGRMAVVDEFAEAQMIVIPQFTDTDKRGDNGSALREGSMGRVLGIEHFMDQGIEKHVAGTMQTETPLVDVGGDVQPGATSMDIDDTGAGTQTIAEGDLFTVDGTPGYQGVFTNTTTAIAGQITGATFFPPAPAGGFIDDSGINIVASHTKNIVWSPGAFTAVAFPPVASDATPSRAFFDAESGLGVLVTFDRNSTNLVDTVTFEMLAGALARQPELAVVLLG